MAGRGRFPVVRVDFTELESALVRLESAVDSRMRMALQQVAGEVADHAKEHHEYQDRTGRLTQSIRAEEVQGSFSDGFRVNMIAGGLRVSYASHVEFGTRPHVIEPRRRKALRFIQNGETRFARRVRHPGTRAYHFMTNALAAKTERLEKMMDLALELAAEEAGLV